MNPIIPVFVNVYNRLATTKTLCDQISRLDGAEIIIVDNNSDYEPLLEWYDDCPFEVLRLRENIGHHAPWLSGIVNQDQSEWYVVTDCDLDLSGVPQDLLRVLRIPFSWGSGVVKSGIGLRIDDLPPWQNAVVEWESRWWKRPVRNDRRFYWAAVDTTFAMYHRSTIASAMEVARIKSTRTGGEYQARHVPWYLDASNLDEENRQYFATANGSNSWKPQGRKLVASYAPRST
tara:strand:- start:1206 stop:1901 length:696 start_codon:yes stop_codon:yes gene_type:complete